MTETLRPSHTPTLANALPSPTELPAAIPPSLTPLPTLNPVDAQSTVMGLLQGNAGCSIPCWWGIVPGEATWEVVKQDLARFARIGAGESAFKRGSDGQVHHLESWTAQYTVQSEPSPGFTSFSVVDGKVLSIDVGPVGTHLSFNLGQLLTKLGEPEDIRVEGEQIGDGSWPFRLYISYPSQGVFVFFDAKARPSDAALSMCLPPYARPELYLRSPHSGFTLEELMSWQDPSGDALHLADATGLTATDFYQQYKGPPTDACLTTPEILWLP